MRLLSLLFAFYALIAAASAAWVYYNSLETALKSDRAAGRVRISEATSRLRGQLDIFRVLVNIIAKDPKITRALNLQSQAEVSTELTRLQLTYGAWEIDLVSQERRVLASSSPKHNGYVYSQKLIRSALNGRLGYAVEIDEGERLVRFSRGILGSEAKTIGAVVVSANLAALEFEWPVTPEPILFFDSAGLSMSANRSNLLLLSNTDDPEEAPFPLVEKKTASKATLWNFPSDEGTATEVQTLKESIPQLQMTGQILLDTKGARTTAALRLGLALALFVVLALIAAVFVQQRRRLALESRQSATLEQRVEERTAQLSAAQSELVEASNLAALGRLSAGVSHELNQPLGAILNFAENGKRLLQKSRQSEASENLSHITDQVRRITRIIGNLRAFAKQEHTPTERIDLASVVAHALSLMRDDIKGAAIATKLTLPKNPLYVLAGKVRLEQVVLNLVSNAIDAMQESADKVLTVTLKEQGDAVSLAVQDTGSGIEDQARVFEPFYTTKNLGSSKGLGMGLALSFGLVSHFGGQLTCKNLANGAEFTMSLPKAGEPE